MIWYLARKYAALVLVLAILLMMAPMAFGTSPGEVVGKAFFFSSLAAAPLTYWEFRRRNLWPLYDNLRLPRFMLLAALAGVVEGFVLVASLVFFW